MVLSGEAMNDKPISIESLVKFYRGFPHQMAALSELDADLLANGAAALNRSRPWFKTWSTAGMMPEGNAAAPYLKLTRAGKADARGLEILLLERFKNNIPLATMRVVSGAPGAQQFRKGKNSLSGSMEPIPEGQWGIGQIAWAGGSDNFAASWGPGLGPASVPLTFKGPGATARSAIEAHFDANLVLNPGTAGCLGFNSLDDLKTFIYWLRSDHAKHLYVDWGLGSCPKPA